MLRRLTVPFAFMVTALLPAMARACECLIVYPICQEVHASDAVFIGVAESVHPKFLDYWRTESGKLPLDEIARLRAQATPDSLEKLRAIYLDMAGELPPGERLALEKAGTFRDLEDAFNSIAMGGVRTRFRVLKSYKKIEKPAEPMIIWSDAGDCGIHFQTGETYLVYADFDEETGRLKTSICYRTRRLADAGADMAFLYRYEQGGEFSSRLEGFVTGAKQQDRPTYTNKIRDPVPDVAVALALPGGERWSTTSDAEGRFWFDGLRAGEYELSAFGKGYPLTVRELAGPQRIKVPAKGCAMDVIGIAPGVPWQ
jgi:hypothetical protein